MAAPKDAAEVDLAFVGAVFAVYALTAAPTVVGGDSGELLAEACQLGTIHPPGYPLFTMAWHLVMRSGEGMMFEPAFLANVACGACGALAAGFLGRAGRDLGAHRWAAAAGSGLYAFSPLVWQYSASAEVFALNNLLCAALLASAVRYARTGSLTSLRAGALLCGLALSNQHTSILLVVPLVAWMCLLLWERKDARLLIAQLAVLFLVGLAPYAYLPLSEPRRGSWGDVKNLRGLFHHLRRADYGTFKLYSGNDQRAEGTLDRAIAYLKDLSFAQAPYCLLPALALAGLVKCGSRSKNRSICLALVSSWAFYVAVFHFLANLPLENPLLFGVHARFWMQPNLIVGLLAVMGVELLGRFGFRGPICAILIALQLRRGYMAAPGGIFTELFGLKPAAWYFGDYARALLNPLPQNAVLLINYDQQWTSVRYAQTCLNIRPDVTLLNLSMMTYAWFASKRALYPELRWPGTHYAKHNTRSWQEGGFTMHQFLEANPASSIFLGGKLSFDDGQHSQKYQFLPFGLLSEVVQQAPPLDLYVERSRDVWNSTLKEMRSLAKETDGYDETTWEWTIKREFFDHAAERAAYILERAIAEQHENRAAWLFEAALWLEYCLAYDTSSPSSVPKNLGLAYVHLVKSPNVPINFVPDVLGAKGGIINGTFRSMRELHPTAFGPDWKTWASSRFTAAWADFLGRPDAPNDPQFEMIQGIYTQVTTKKQQQRGAS